MSTAVLQQVVKAPAQRDVDNSQSRVADDPHPLVPIFLLGAIALAGAVLVVGTMVALLSLRSTGMFAAF